MSAHGSHSSAPSTTLSLSGALRRLPGVLVRPIALLTVGAIALGGVTLAQSWMSGSSADAVTRQNGWDGHFDKNLLWLKGTGGYEDLRAWTDPQNLVPPVADSESPILFEANGTTNGTRAGGRETAAVGPIFKSATGSTTRHMVTISSGGGTSVFIDAGNGTVNGSDWGDIPQCGIGSLQAQWSAEINQQNGYLYTVGAAYTAALNGTATTWTDIKPRILQVNSSSGFTCIAATSTITSAVANTGITAQYNAMTSASVSGSWDVSSDMAIDANGNLYIMLTRDASNHALARINISDWTLEIVKGYRSSATNSRVWGMAFMDGALYTVHANDNFYRWNTLSDEVTLLNSSAPGGPLDLAGAQAAPVIEGTIYNDKNANGVIDPGEAGVPNVTVEIFQGNAASGSTTWTKRGEAITNDSGNYSALLNSASTEFVVRVKRPKIGNANATQTYANAGRFYEAGGTSGEYNTLTPYCTQGVGADYAAQTTSGTCLGARIDGIDALNTAQGSSGNPFSATGGAAIVSKVSMNTDLAVVSANFGITTVGSWGDSPLSPTTNAQSGPYANPKRGADNYLYLGSTPGLYADGVNDSQASAHATDDGVDFAPVPASNVVEDGAWSPVQGGLMVAGKKYRLRVKVSGDAAAVTASTVRAWITSVSSSGIPSTTFDKAITCTTPDTGGYSYCDYQADTGLPSNASVAVNLRVRVSSDPAVSVNSGGPSDPQSMPWVPKGEVEDYQLGVAGAVLRVFARTTGGVAANVRLVFGNISNVTPSYPRTAILTSAQGGFVPSSLGHAITSRTSNVVITTEGVGAVGDTGAGLNGWHMGIREIDGVKDTYCYDAETGGPVNTAVSAGSTMLSVVGSTSAPIPEQVNCYLTYIPDFDAKATWVTADPSDNESDPLVITSDPATAEGSAVILNVMALVRDANGVTQTVPSEGEIVTLRVSPITGSGATSGGGTLQYRPDADSAWTDVSTTYSCRVDTSGTCPGEIRLIATEPGGYNLTAQVGDVYILNQSTQLTTNVSPVKVWFRPNNPSSDNSSMTVTSGNQKANHNDPRTDPAPVWGKHVVTVTLKSSSGQPYKDGVGHLHASSPLDDGSEG
ncbi:MAG: hypothetical protein LBE08_06395, partial [Bifidobacteriaceae bacterium]|nr:hypothetical protein [Bifidobacteriaceae bacterium]